MCNVEKFMFLLFIDDFSKLFVKFWCAGNSHKIPWLILHYILRLRPFFKLLALSTEDNNVRNFNENPLATKNTLNESIWSAPYDTVWDYF